MKLKNEAFFHKIKKEFAFQNLCLYNSQFLYGFRTNVEHIVGIAKPQRRNTNSKSGFNSGQRLVGPVKHRGYGFFTESAKGGLPFRGEIFRPKITPSLSSLSSTKSNDKDENSSSHFTPRFVANGDSGILGT